MKFTIIGSGGCVSTPRPLCTCPVCAQARLKGAPYSRHGCSLYIEEIGLLIDTPEDIIAALNRAQITKVDTLLYSHADPDHTMGMRVLEQMRLDWLADSVGKTCEQPIMVGGLKQVLDDVRKQGTFYGSAIDYYESRNLIRTEAFCKKHRGSIDITLVPVDAVGHVTIFVFEENGHKVIYAPCDVKPFPKNPIFQGADVLIIGDTIIGDILKDGFVLEMDNPLREELFVMEEVMRIKEHYAIKEVLFTHLEEDWGKSYDDYCVLEKEMEGVRFAYDGMEIVV